MKKSFWSLVWSSFLRTQGALIGVIAIVSSVLLWRLSPNKNISLGLALPIGLLCVVLILTLGYAAYESFKMSKRILPRVLFGKKSSTKNQKPQVLCLLEPSEIFSYDAVVSFYYIDEGFEQLIGIGTVTNIQENGKIQVVMTYSNDVYEETINELADNNARVLNKIIVKPNVPKSVLDIMISQGG